MANSLTNLSRQSPSGPIASANRLLRDVAIINVTVPAATVTNAVAPNSNVRAGDFAILRGIGSGGVTYGAVTTLNGSLSIQIINPTANPINVVDAVVDVLLINPTD